MRLVFTRDPVTTGVPYSIAVQTEGVYESGGNIYLSFWERIREIGPDGTFGNFVDPNTSASFTFVPSSDWDITR